jgi:uncharacterized protein YwqG
MAKKQTISFREIALVAKGLSTKFGGQPDWATEPQWPLSRETGNAMRFICQIGLSRELFPSSNAKMAYIFMTDEEDGDFVDGTYDPGGGENAVILQPGSTSIPTARLAHGPSLYKMVKKPGQKLLVPEACQFEPILTDGEDADPVADVVAENKIGGSPAFLQGEEFPFEGNCSLLLQLDSCSVPFYVNFGDAGAAYAFLNRAGDQGKFLWQCC